MFIVKILIGILLFTSILSLIAIFFLGIVLGPILKKYDPDEYQRQFVLFMPFSGTLLNDYARTKSNLEKIPENKRWVLIALRRLIPYFLISFSVGCILAYIASEIG